VRSCDGAAALAARSFTLLGCAIWQGVPGGPCVGIDFDGDCALPQGDGALRTRRKSSWWAGRGRARPATARGALWLAIRGVDDALWEWNLKNDRAYFSTRWKSMLGYADHELSDRIDEWSERVHPDDHEAFMQALKRHLEGLTARLEHEHRLRHRDGSWRWVTARASLVRDATGEPSRIVGLMSDITARKRVEEAIVEIAEGLSATRCGESLAKAGAQLCRGAGRARGFRLRMQRLSDYARAHAGALEAGDYARCVEFDLSVPPAKM
jgi:PAS domain S-box-containing protein